ncbi:MAG TPA: lipopolysaccharide biosynthesis protein [Longimicrobiaceae bacterium]|nr:lipopolysaccharide biosynthesis protein [Longimicrobiaceae bacterium]
MPAGTAPAAAPPTASLATRSLRGGAWQGGAMACQAVVQLVVLAVLARYVSPTGFGLAAIATMVSGFTAFLSQAGLGAALIQRKAVTDRQVRVAFTTSVLLGATAFGVIWLLAPFIARYFSSPAARDVIRGSALAILFTGFGIVARSLLARDLRFRALAKVDVIAVVIAHCAVSIPMAVAGFGAWSVVAGQVVQALLSTVGALLVTRHTVSPLLGRTELRELTGFGSALTAAQLLNYAAHQLDYLVIGRRLGTTPLGLYERAFRLMQVPGYLLGEVLDRVMFPIMCKLQDRARTIGLVYVRLLGAAVTVLGPTAIVMIVLAPEIVVVVLGRKWMTAVLPFQILMLSVPTRICVRLSDSLVRAIGAVGRSATRKAALAASVLAGAWVGSHWGIVGVATGVAGAFFLNFVLMCSLGLGLVQRGWGEMLWHQRHNVLLGVVTLAAVGGAKLLALQVTSSSAVVLAAGTLGAGVALAAVVVAFPRILGVGGLWLLGEIATSAGLRARLSPRFRALLDEAALTETQPRGMPPLPLGEVVP